MTFGEIEELNETLESTSRLLEDIILVNNNPHILKRPEELIHIGLCQVMEYVTEIQSYIDREHERMLGNKEDKK